MTLTDFVPPEEHAKRATKHFCDWVTSLVSKPKLPLPVLFDFRNLTTSFRVKYLDLQSKNVALGV